jgi:hypothetical protein
VNQRTYKTSNAGTRLNRHALLLQPNVIISHLIVYKEGLGYLSVCCIASRSYPPSHVCICNGHRSSELFCVHCTSHNRRVLPFPFISQNVTGWKTKPFNYWTIDVDIRANTRRLRMIGSMTLAVRLRQFWFRTWKFQALNCCSTECTYKQVLQMPVETSVWW